jgi:hypothetical protein
MVKVLWDKGIGDGYNAGRIPKIEDRAHRPYFINKITGRSIKMYKVDIKDVIRNYDLRNDEGFLFCLFEAVSNALYYSMENTKSR